MAYCDFPVARIRWREPCVKIIVLGNLFFAVATCLSIGLSAGLRPSVNIAESNGVHVTSQLKIPCTIDHRMLFYGYGFFTIIRNTFVIKGTICRDIAQGKWLWKFKDPTFSQYNSN